MKNYINRFGYHIAKDLLENNDLKKIKDDLNVKPIINKNYSPDVDPYDVYDETKDHIIIPQHYARKFNYKNKIDLPKHSKSENINISFKGDLRDYQKEIINTCITKINKEGGGIISIPCGGGKTVLALHIAYLLKVKTLVVTHKSFLLNQWVERATEFTDARIGIIRQNKIDVKDKDIVIGMLQSIAMKDYDDDIFKGFGLVIYDECHHTPSRVFSKCLSRTCFQYTVGLSATYIRADGLTKVIHWYLGELIYKMEKKQDNNVYIKSFEYKSNDPLFIEKSRWFQGKVSPSIPIMVTNISKINGRNIFINNIIENLFGQKGRKILVLSHRLEHLDNLKTLCDNTIKNKIKTKELEIGEIITSKYIGGMKESEQEIAAQADIIFASYALAEEGLDIDGLNTLILATPKTNIIQSIGRIMRKPIKSGDIFPMIIDIVDTFSVFSRWGIKRMDYYKAQKYNINNYKAYNDKCITLEEYLINQKYITKEDITEDEDVCFHYICQTEDKYAYSAKMLNNSLDEYWNKINYSCDYNDIFNIKYEWDINFDNYKKVTIKPKVTKTKKNKKVEYEDDILTHKIKK